MFSYEQPICDERKSHSELRLDVFDSLKISNSFRNQTTLFALFFVVVVFFIFD